MNQPLKHRVFAAMRGAELVSDDDLALELEERPRRIADVLAAALDAGEVKVHHQFGVTLYSLPKPVPPTTGVSSVFQLAGALS